MTDDAAPEVEYEPPPATLPPPPRAVTSRVRWRAWVDPLVRFWWLAAAFMLVAGTALGVSAYRIWAAERDLMSAPVVQGTINRTAGETVQNRPVPRDVAVEITATRDGQPIKLNGVIRGYTKPDKKTLMLGDTIPVHVDPNDPTRWTARNEPQPLMTAIAGALITASLALLPGSLAVVTWLGVLRVWRTGEERPAEVARRQQSALAPRAGSTRCVLADAEDRRMFTLFVPPRSAEASAEVIRVLAPPTGRGRTLAAAWFE